MPSDVRPVDTQDCCSVADLLVLAAIFGLSLGVLCFCVYSEHADEGGLAVFAGWTLMSLPMQLGAIVGMLVRGRRGAKVGAEAGGVLVFLVLAALPVVSVLISL